jgi:solute carrier family 25 phosphate transporter 23/24/25/41
MDVLRRRFQVGSMSGVGTEHYKNVWHAIVSISQKEGIKGFYKGLVPNLLKVAPSMAASWLSFEMVKDFLVGR